MIQYVLYIQYMYLDFRFTGVDILVCPRSLDPIYTEAYYKEWVKTSRTYSTVNPQVEYLYLFLFNLELNTRNRVWIRGVEADLKRIRSRFCASLLLLPHSLAPCSLPICVKTYCIRILFVLCKTCWYINTNTD